MAHLDDVFRAAGSIELESENGESEKNEPWTNQKI